MSGAKASTGVDGTEGRLKPMIGKRVQFDEETWAAINLLRQERRRSFQQLADEAFTDLLQKHRHPVGLKDQLRASAGNSNKKSPKTFGNTE